MLNSVEYSVSFPTTGREFQNKIEFAPGLTAITGRNEAGKTIVMEMVGYCLFGKEALRGLASDYRNLNARLDATVGNDSWVLDRKPRSETFTVNGEVVAVGAEAINKEVPSRLGFDMKVFNIACAAQQGDIGKLTEMLPSARRKMIDQLVGLDVLEAVEKQCRDEANTHEAVAASLIMSQAAPQEPVKPEFYVASEEASERLAQMLAQQAERNILLGVKKPLEPTAPLAPEFTDVAALEAHERERALALQTQARLEGELRGIPVPQYSRSELEKAIAYGEYLAEVARRGPSPHHAVVYLDEQEHLIHQKAQLRGDTLNCPKCEHEFSASNPDLDVAAIVALPDPVLSDREIAQDRRRHALWAEPLAEVEAIEIPNIQQEVLAHARADDRTAIVVQLEQLIIPSDRSGDLRAARAFESERAIYAERAARFDGELAYYQDAQSRLAHLGDQSEAVATLQWVFGESRKFEADLQRFAEDQLRYAELVERAGAAKGLAEGFKRGGVSLRNARVKVKQELAPSLSQAASTLITAMTNGERRSVEVDHDLNIVVDGQPLQTLSGSGKSVVNLALRIGLGQVLTSRVLPIFMGDEIDKDMDQERASSTHETMQNLKQYLTQIILVTHKEIEADHLIQL